MTLGATLLASFLVALVRPAAWLLALATFLLRGGVLLVLAPIVVIPSAVGLANVLAPAITTIVFEGVSVSLAILVGGTVVATVAWLIGGGLLAAVAEAELIRLVAADEEVASAVPRPPEVASGRHVAWRILAVRLVALLPLVVALAWGAARIVSVTYRELTVPSDVTTPLVLRVARETPEAIIAILITWLVGEIVAGLAARSVVLHGDGVGRALRWAVVHGVHHPIRAVVLALVPLAGLAVVAIPSAFGVATAWRALRGTLATGGGAPIGIGVLLLFVALWLGGLVLIAAMSAWRSAAWTVEAAGTFGASTDGREGDWNAPSESATLTDLRSPGVDPDTR